MMASDPEERITVHYVVGGGGYFAHVYFHKVHTHIETENHAVLSDIRTEMLFA